MIILKDSFKMSLKMFEWSCPVWVDIVTPRRLKHKSWNTFLQIVGSGSSEISEITQAIAIILGYPL